MTPRASADLRRTVEVVLHLTGREFRLRYSTAALGWVWAVAPTMARLGVLAVVFTRVLPVDSKDYVADLAVGLLAWTWFSSGVSNATRAPADRRDLLAQPNLPRGTLPAVSVLTDGLDYAAALPLVLAVVVIVTGSGPGAALLLLPVLLLLQGLLTLGLGMAAAVADVKFRDARLAVDLVLSLGFYATPVFYSLDAVPADIAAVLEYNPVAQLLEAQRDVIVDGVLPSVGVLAALTLLSSAVAAGGWWLHRRAAVTFLDDL